MTIDFGRIVAGITQLANGFEDCGAQAALAVSEDAMLGAVWDGSDDMAMSGDRGGVGKRHMVVVFRAPSAVVINEHETLRVRVPLQVGELTLTFRTRYLDKGLEHPLPGDLWIEGRGPAESIEEAVSHFGGAAASVIAVIALATNAAVHHLEPELAFDETPGVSAREFLQSLLPEERAILGQARPLDKGSLVVLLEAIEGHEERERIGRAVAQYQLALRHWRFGHEVMATAHLYIGIEALTRAVMRRRQKAAGVSKEEFAQSLGIDLAERGSNTLLEAAIRRAFLFHRDDECYQSAKLASDGFEHGFMPFDQVREYAVKVRDKTATYLRQAILDLLNLDDAVRAKLLSPPRTEPLGRWPVVRYVRGQLVGDGAELALEGNDYPMLAWRSSIRSVTLEESGEQRIEIKDELSPQLGHGIQFQMQSFEVWGP